MKKILVTGAAGFIGHKVCEFLLADGHAVVGVDNLNNYYDVGLKKRRFESLLTFDQFSFVKGDIEDLDFLDTLFAEENFDVVFNLAARAGVRYSMENPHIYVSTNIQGSLNVLECMRKFKVNKYILASTSSLYAGQKMPFKEDLPVNEPISPYAATKKAAEAMAYTYHKLFSIDVSILRYFTVYGPNSRPDMALDKFSKAIKTETEFEVYGDGSQARDFTYVDDIARGTILAMKELGYEIINLGGGKTPISINRMIELLESEFDKKAKVRHSHFHAADMKKTWADISKAKRLLGWEPKVTFEQGIKASCHKGVVL